MLRRRVRRILSQALPAFLGLALWALMAEAEPTLWEKVREPEATRSERLFRKAERLLVTRPKEGQIQQFLETRRGMVLLLEAELARSKSDVRLAFALGELYGSLGIDAPEEARRVLEGALARAPDSPLAGMAYFQLGVARGKLGDLEAELAAYDQAIERLWDPEIRANALLNRAETHLMRGALTKAIADYRSADQLAEAPELSALAEYGLAVALERSGDLPSALDAVMVARSYWPKEFSFTALDLPSVFFVPAYEIHYYKGIEQLALGREKTRTGEREAAAQGWSEAIAQFDRYLGSAPREGGPWVSNAERLRAYAQRRLLQRPGSDRAQ